MTNEISTKRAIESKDHEGYDHRRQDGMAHEDCEVDRSNNARSLKTCGAVVIVIREIRSEKQDRNHERGYLARAVSNNIPRSDKRVPGEKQKRAGAVETSVEVRQIRNVLTHSFVLFVLPADVYQAGKQSP